MAATDKDRTAIRPTRRPAALALGVAPVLMALVLAAPAFGRDGPAPAGGAVMIAQGTLIPDPPVPQRKPVLRPGGPRGSSTPPPPPGPLLPEIAPVRPPAEYAPGQTLPPVPPVPEPAPPAFVPPVNRPYHPHIEPWVRLPEPVPPSAAPPAPAVPPPVPPAPVPPGP